MEHVRGQFDSALPVFCKSRMRKIKEEEGKGDKRGGCEEEEVEGWRERRGELHR